MKHFKTLKLKTKLMLCMSLLSLATIIVGGLGINKMITINQRSQAIYSGSLVPSLYLSGLQQELTDLHTYYLHVAYGGQKAEINVLKEKMAELNEMLEGYGSCNLDSEERALYDVMHTQFLNYNNQIEDEFEYLITYPEAQSKERMNRVIGYAEAAQNALNELFAKARDAATEEVAQNKADTKVEIIRLIVIAIICIVLAYTLAALIIKRIAEQIHAILDSAEKVTEGNLNTKIEVVSEDEIGQLAVRFNKMIENLNEVMINIDSASEQVNMGARQVAHTSTLLSQGATEQASTVEELTAAVEEINVQIKNNADHANTMNDIAAETKKLVEKSHHGMQDMLEAMENINFSSSEVAKIIRVIDDIAFQTNILALNAAVEAARAGQHGKGFTVVAEEVRNLAARSAEAAKETTGMIESSIKNANIGMSLAKETAGQLDLVVNSIKEVADLTDEIAISCNEQSIGIAQINQGALQISNVVQNNSATSQEAAAASQELAGQAEVMRTEVAKFETGKRYVSTYRRHNEYVEEYSQPHHNYNVNLVGDSEFGKY